MKVKLQDFGLGLTILTVANLGYTKGMKIRLMTPLKIPSTVIAGVFPLYFITTG